MSRLLVKLVRSSVNLYPLIVPSKNEIGFTKIDVSISVSLLDVLSAIVFTLSLIIQLVCLQFIY